LIIMEKGAIATAGLVDELMAHIVHRYMTV
jgi:hypothetical protein